MSTAAALKKLQKQMVDKTDKLEDKVMKTTDKIEDKFQKGSDKFKQAVDHVSPYWFTLKEVTQTDNVYYTKCMQILDEFTTSNITSSIPKLHDASDHQNNWESVKTNAEKCKEALYFYLQKLKESVHQKESQNESTNDVVEVIEAPIKKYERSLQKVDLNYDGNWLRLLDVCRSCLVHDNFQQLYSILFILCKYYSNCYGFEIVRIKNRYQKPTDQGWADIVLLVRPSNKMDAKYKTKNQEDSKMNEEEENMLKSVKDVEIDNGSLPNHICEVQLIHSAMWQKRKNGLFGHKAYKVQRDVDSATIKMGASVGVAKHVNGMVDFRNKVVASAGQKVFVKDENVKEKEKHSNKMVVVEAGDASSKKTIKKVMKKIRYNYKAKPRTDK